MQINNVEVISVPNYENTCVSRDGNVYTLQKISRHKIRYGWKQSKTSYDKDGYVTVHVKKENIWITVKVHTLIALTFVGPKPTPQHEVNHKNTIKHDNRADNLEWLLHVDNMIAASKANVIATCERVGISKLTKEKVIKIRELYGKFSYAKIAEMFNVSTTTIADIMNDRRWIF